MMLTGENQNTSEWFAVREIFGKGKPKRLCCLPYFHAFTILFLNDSILRLLFFFRKGFNRNVFSEGGILMFLVLRLFSCLCAYTHTQ